MPMCLFFWHFTPQTNKIRVPNEKNPCSMKHFQKKWYFWAVFMLKRAHTYIQNSYNYLHN